MIRVGLRVLAAAHTGLVEVHLGLISVADALLALPGGVPDTTYVPEARRAHARAVFGHNEAWSADTCCSGRITILIYLAIDALRLHAGGRQIRGVAAQSALSWHCAGRCCEIVSSCTHTGASWVHDEGMCTGTVGPVLVRFHVHGAVIAACSQARGS